MKESTITRREFLRRGALASVTLPLISGLESLWASGAPRAERRRLVILYSPHGTIPPEFFPKENAAPFTLPRILEPLRPHQDRLLILNGIANLVPGNGASLHAIGVAALLTGQQMIGTPGNPEGPAAGISIDQEVARFFAQSADARTRFPSLEFGDFANLTLDPRTRISYTGPGVPATPENDPRRMFARIFGDLAVNAKKRSVLDFTLGELARLKSSLSASDARLLDIHADAVRTLERSLVSSDSSLANCAAPSLAPAGLTIANRPISVRQQIDILVRALACRQTNVATLQFTWGGAGCTMTYPWLGINDGHHALSHAEDDDLVAREKLVKINRWFAEQVAYLLDSLAATPESEGDGSLLDHTVVIWMNDFIKGNTHDLRHLPIVIAGSRQYFKLGRSLKFEGVPHNRFLVSVCHSMGHPVAAFGDEKLSAGGAIAELAG